MSLLHGINNQFMYLSRARANAQLIKVLEEGGVLVTEKDQVEEWLKDFANAEAKFTNFIAELKEELKAPTPDPTPLSPGGHRSVETLADEAGVTDQSGSFLPAEDVRPKSLTKYPMWEPFFFFFGFVNLLGCCTCAWMALSEDL